MIKVVSIKVLVLMIRISVVGLSAKLVIISKIVVLHMVIEIRKLIKAGIIFILIVATHSIHNDNANYNEIITSVIILAMINNNNMIGKKIIETQW